MAAPKTRTRRRLTSEERRERILGGATRVFAERGYQEASMAAIARAGGITPAVIYDHFPSKAALHVTLLERATAAMLGAIGTALEAAPDALDERLRAGLDAFFGYVEDDPFAWRMIFRDAPSDPAVQTAYRRLGGGTTTAVEGFLRASAPPGMLDGPGTEHRAEAFAKLLTASMTGLAFWWYENREVPREVIVGRVLEFCWTGLERIAGGE